MNRRNFLSSVFLGAIPNLVLGNKKHLFSHELFLTGQLTIHLLGKKCKLQPIVFNAFETMRNDALKEGLNIFGVSGYRSFKDQERIWNDKYENLKQQFSNDNEIVNEILKYTAIPGTSRHHWGTDFDIIDAWGYSTKNYLNDENYSNGGDYQFLKYWLDKNAHKYGFYEVYSNVSERTGFKFEPWHFTYKDLSVSYYQEVLKLDFSEICDYGQCKGLKGIANESFFKNYKVNYISGIENHLKSCE